MIIKLYNYELIGVYWILIIKKYNKKRQNASKSVKTHNYNI